MNTKEKKRKRKVVQQVREKQPKAKHKHQQGNTIETRRRKNRRQKLGSREKLNEKIYPHASKTQGRLQSPEARANELKGKKKKESCM